MKYVISKLSLLEAELESEIERLNNLKGNPNEKLRQISLRDNRKRKEEVSNAIEILVEHLE